MTRARTVWGVSVFFVGSLAGCSSSAPVTSPGPTCSPDSTVASCVGGASGYSCSGTDTPDQSDASLICSAGVVGTGATEGDLDYCCIQYASAVTTTCVADSNVMGCMGASIGFSCAGGDTPELGYPDFTCSVGVPGTGATAADTIYCCAPATTPDTCMADATVPCLTGANGYSCTGAAVPDASTLLCSEPTLTTTGASFCCFMLAAGTPTCSQDQGIVCPTPGSFGFSCSSTDMPTAEYSGLTSCSTGVSVGSTTQYCCH
jgi:hypothetical protein